MSFLVIVDAGSSGSRVQIYSYSTESDLNHKDNAGNPWQLKIEPGLSAFAFKIDEIKAYLQKLIDYALSVVPEGKHSETPLYIYATAGMRLLPRADQNRIKTATCMFLENTPFHVVDCDRHFRVISGEEEGLFGWVAANYILNKMQGETVGFLDMGGASAQIAYENPYANRTVQLLGRTFHVHVQTFLGYGSNESYRRHLKALIAAKAESDPCANPGMVSNVGEIKLQGTGDYLACRALSQRLLTNFTRIHTPRRFVGVSEYWYSTHDVLGLGGPYHADVFDAVAQKFCRRPWPELLSEHRSGAFNNRVKLRRLQMQCFKSAWISAVLHDGFGIPRHHSNFLSAELPWTTGAALLHAMHHRYFPKYHYILVPLLAVLAWAFSVLYRVHRLRRRKPLAFTV